MATTEVNWTSVGPDGRKRQACAHRIGKNWVFYARSGRFEDWQEQQAPPLEDWMELLDGVRRRIGRRLARPEDEQLVLRAIRERFPEADVT